MRNLAVFGFTLALSSSSVALAGDCVSANACYQAAMPLYNQNNGSISSYWLPNGPDHSMLCGPASGAMAVQAVYGNLWKAEQAKVVGWTRTHFVGLTPAKQIEAMAGLMGTDPRSGTYFYPILDGYFSSQLNAMTNLTQNAKNFPVTGGSDGSVSTWGPVVDVNRYVNRMRATHKFADILLHGHYKRHTSCLLGACASYFTRDGGHIVAVKGHETVNGVQTVLIHNPWYGQRQNHVFGQVYAADDWTVTVLPKVGIQSSYLYRGADNYYAIVDGELGIWAGNSNGPEPTPVFTPTHTINLTNIANTFTTTPVKAVKAGAVLR